MPLPVCRRQSNAPVRASKATISPVASAAKTRPPAVESIEATIGCLARQTHSTRPVAGSNACRGTLLSGPTGLGPPLHSRERCMHEPDEIVKVFIQFLQECFHSDATPRNAGGNSMPVPRVKLDSLKGTRGRVIDLLRRSDLTANEIAARMDLTHNAVRSHLAALQREGLIREGGSRRSGTRPAVIYALVPKAEAIFSRAYVPFVAHLVRVLQEKLDQQELDAVMRMVG